MLYEALTGKEGTISDNESHKALAYVDDLTQVVGNKYELMLLVFIQELYDTMVS